MVRLGGSMVRLGGSMVRLGGSMVNMVQLASRLMGNRLA
jgi:hypothetical protein